MTKVLITGGSGLVGSQLSKDLVDDGCEVSHLSRKVTGKEPYPTYEWDPGTLKVDGTAFEGVDHIIHLAGAGIADKRWTGSRKEEILKSRVDGIKTLHKAIRDHDISLKSFISASAIGYYGADTGHQLITEKSPPGNDFLADVVKQWEDEADSFQSITQVAKVRIGVVLSDHGGALPAIARPIKFWVGAPLGSGNQYMSWIHIEDLSAIFKFILKNEIEGTYNAAAPNPVTNKELTRQIAHILRKPLLLPNVPSFVLKLMLGEMSQMVLGGSKVSGETISERGFKYKWQRIDKALQDLLGT